VSEVTFQHEFCNPFVTGFVTFRNPANPYKYNIISLLRYKVTEKIQHAYDSERKKKMENMKIYEKIHEYVYMYVCAVTCMYVQ